ncbi:MAG: hypothetical protein ABIJ47_01575 [Candidatus Bathyarchaeota archaeon]
MVPLAERRHRLNSDEIEPVRDAALARLQLLVEARELGTIDEAGSLYRVWFRIETHVTHKPAYPPHETWMELAQQLSNGTIRGFAPRGALGDQEED